MNTTETRPKPEKPLGHKAYGSIKDRLAAHTLIEGECWLWTAHCNKGYGRINIDGKIKEAHRVSYLEYRGAIPEGHVLHHLETCGHTNCINPWHVEPMTQTEHVKQKGHAVAIGAEKTHCPKGHPYESWNLVKRSNPNRRDCAECNRIRAMANYNKNKKSKHEQTT